MFGYIRPDLPNLYIKDSVLYRSFYCGLCKSIGANIGVNARFSLSYDLAFLSAIIHNIMGEDVKIVQQNCILHPITKRPIVTPDEISKKIAYLNVMLAYYKLTDDIIDLKKGRFLRSFFGRGYKKALKQEPALNQIIKTNFESLLQLEKEKNKSIDMAAHPFGQMLGQISNYLLQELASPSTYNLFYSIGKFIYLIDALDDYDKDLTKNNYNVFINYFAKSSKSDLIAQNINDLNYVFGSIFQTIKESLANIKFNFNSDLTDNILLKGMPEAYKKVIKRKRPKCKKHSIKF